MNTLKAPSLQSLLDSDRGSTDSLLAESLQLDVEDLDDVEYSIPPTGALPTLETVLSEFEADSDIASEFGVPIPTPTPTPSISEDNAVRGCGGTVGGSADSTGAGSIMRCSQLQGVSTQISSAADRVHAGLATACAVSGYITIGTSHGHILNFDTTQTLRWAHQDKHGQGAVSALALNTDYTRLLAGYARGLVSMFDTQSGDVLRNLFDVVTPNTGVLHVKWTSRPALALSADSGGSVWSLSFTRKLGIRGCSSRCLFSGARGEVCTVEPLIMEGNGQHELDQYCIVALATLSKYFIVTIRPRLKVIKYYALQGPTDCLPVMSWQMVLIQAADTTRSVDPVIVVGRGNQIFFHQLFMAHGRISLLYLRHVQLQANLLSAHWLGPKCVGCLDTSEIFHLIDVRSSKELECVDLANAGLVYGSAQFKALATGGNVSPALALAGTHACYNSLATRGTQLYVLGARSLYMLSVRSWTERISYLVKNQRWQEACDLALEGYNAAKDRPKRRAQAKERILMLFKDYVAASTRAPEYCLGAIVKCLIAVDELDCLWMQLWEGSQNRGLFLQHISEHIENDTIQRISPVISQALVDHWLEISPSKLEDLILKLDWMCLDLNQVLKAAKRHKLYRAQIYLNTHAFNDYLVSLTELVPLVQADPPELGNSLLVYISSCLAGRGFPSGDLPVEIAHKVKTDVWQCLIARHTRSEDLPYPYLRALLKFDTRETLNVVSLAFQEKEFMGEGGLMQRKQIVNILLEIMTPDNATWSEIGCLLNFIAQQISMQFLPRDPELLQRVLNYLGQEEIANESARQHSERENAWHELLANNCLELISGDEEQLAMAWRSRCYYVVEYLLEKLQRYDNILECYVKNSQRHETMFCYIDRHAGQPERMVYVQVRRHFAKLLKINSKETVRIVDLHFREHIEELLDVVCDDEDALFIFLDSLYRRQVHATLTPEHCEQLLELLAKRSPDKVDEFLRTNETYRPERALEIVQRYQMIPEAIYLYEKKQDYRRAFDMAMELLVSCAGTNAPNEAEKRALYVSSLCARISPALDVRLRETYWFELLKLILPRDDLKAITKSMLHEASQYVDLPNLVQLVLNTHNVSGSYGDIKELLMSMLSNSRYETQAVETVANILGQDLHKEFALKWRETRRGRWVTMTRCVLCQNRLYTQTDSVLILRPCGHAMHEPCIEANRQKFETLGTDCGGEGASEPDGCATLVCPRCHVDLRQEDLTEPLHLSQPKTRAIDSNMGQIAGHNQIHAHSHPNSSNAKTNRHHFNDTGVGNARPLGVLQLKAPPRKF